MPEPAPAPAPAPAPNPSPAPLRTVEVSSVAAFRTAVSSALPGDLILVKPGTYRLDSRVSMTRSGTTNAPITVQAEPGAVFQSNTLEMFSVSGSDWIFTDLVIEGVCSVHSNCEHAFHVVGGAHRTRIQRNIVRDFNASIKGNGTGGVSPSDVLIQDNHFYNRTARNTSNPVTLIDVVGGTRWMIRGNTIADFAKNGGNYISYGAFLKGESTDGVMEGNLVICSRDVPNASGTARLGLSLGGGGTGDAYCPGGFCDYEHANGVIRNNIIMNCSDAGIYLNRARASQIVHNTLYQTTGIEVRFVTSTATVANNITSRIANRDGGTHTARTNFVGTNAQIQAIFTNPSIGDYHLRNGASILSKGSDLGTSMRKDMCAQSRDSLPDLGAIEYVSGTVCPRQVLEGYR